MTAETLYDSSLYEPVDAPASSQATYDASLYEPVDAGFDATAYEPAIDEPTWADVFGAETEIAGLRLNQQFIAGPEVLTGMTRQAPVETAGNLAASTANLLSFSPLKWAINKIRGTGDGNLLDIEGPTFTPEQEARILEDPLVVKGLDRYGYHQEQIDAVKPKVDPFSLKGVVGASYESTLSSILPMMATGIVAKPITALGSMGTQVFSTKLAEQVNEGRPIEEAQQTALFYAAAETIPETIPLGIALKAGTPFWKRVLGTAWTEPAQEMLTESLEIGYDKLGLSQEISLKEGMQRIAQAGLVAVIPGVTMGVLGHKPGRPVEQAPTDGAEAQPATEAPSSPLNAEDVLGRPDLSQPPAAVMAAASVDDAIAAAQAHAKGVPASAAPTEKPAVSYLEKALSSVVPPVAAPVVPGEQPVAIVPPIVAPAVTASTIAAQAQTRPELIPVSKRVAPIEAPAAAQQTPFDLAGITSDTVPVEPFGVRRETRENKQGITAEAIPQGTDVSMRPISAQTWAETLPGLPRQLYEELAQVAPNEFRTEEKRQLQALRQQIIEEGQAPENAVRSVWGDKGTNASPGLRQAIARGLDVPTLPSEIAQRIGTRQKLTSQGVILAPSYIKQAVADAKLMTADVLAAYAGGDVTTAANRDFVRAFVGKTGDLSAMMDAGGNLSQDGRRRLEAGLMVAAYGDAGMVSELFESTDTDIKAIGDALREVAGKWADLRDRARDGQIDPQVDLTGNLMQAVQLIRRARQEGKSVYDLVHQADLLTGEAVDLLTEGFIRIFYRGDKFARARSRDTVVSGIMAYVDGALNTRQEADLFGESLRVQPADILKSAGEKLNAKETAPAQGGLFAAGGEPAGQRVETGRREGQRPVGETGRGAPAGAPPQEVTPAKKPKDFRLTPVSQRPPERRTDTVTRKAVAKMSQEEMRRELLTDSLTGLPNRRAYDEAERLPVQSRVDMDGFKTINDNYGHPSGDEVLRVIAQYLDENKGFNGRVYRIGGDEFPGEFKTEAEALDAMESTRKALAKHPFIFELPDGSQKIFTGVGFSYGIGKTENAAETALRADKSRRANEGLRASGRALPQGDAGTSEGKPTQARDLAKGIDDASSEVASTSISKVSDLETSSKQVIPEGLASGPEVTGNLVRSYSFLKKLDDLLEVPSDAQSALSAQQAPDTVDGSTASEKSHLQGVLSHVKALRDIVGSNPFLEHGFSGLDAKTQGLVFSHMVGVAHDRKVLDAVIKFIPVDVMDYLAREKLTPDMVFNNRAVLERQLSVDSKSLVPIHINPADALIRALTLAGAEVGSGLVGSDMTGPTTDVDSTSGTSDGNHRKDDTRNEARDKNGSRIDREAHTAATSPQNELPQPTEAQKDAGNYKVGKINISGLDISVENPEGSKRSGKDASGKPWSITMRSHYGYVVRVDGDTAPRGKDKDHIDVFIKPGTPDDYSGPVFVVDQTDKAGKFDEHKVLLGFDTAVAAKQGYLENYTPGWTGLGAMKRYTLPEFKLWLKAGNTKKPVALGYAEPKPSQTPPVVLSKAPADKPESELDKALRSVGLDPNAPPDKAKALRRQADALAKEAEKALEGIEPGQPVLSSRDRLKREKAAEKMRKAGELLRKAEALEEKQQATKSEERTTAPVAESLAPAPEAGDTGVATSRDGGAPIKNIDKGEAIFSLRNTGDQTDTPEFLKWFGDSKVIDADGKPLVVYHGTKADTQELSADFARGERGIFFTDDTQLAGQFASRSRGIGASNVMPVYLNFKNPLVVDATTTNIGNSFDKLIKDAHTKGNDGVIIYGSEDTAYPDPFRAHNNVYIAFKPEQIKSAIGNRGTFDQNDPSIIFSLRNTGDTGTQTPAFYSQMERVLADKLPGSGMAGDLRLTLRAWMDKGLFKKEEYEWSGIDQWMAEQKGRVTKTQILDFVRANDVEVQEVIKGGNTSDGLTESERARYDEFHARAMNRPSNFTMDEETEYSELLGKRKVLDDTKFASYQLPGGEKYRELLLTLPERPASMPEPELDKNARGLWAWFSGPIQLTGAFENRADAEAARDQANRPSITDTDNFRSSHFTEPNILAHVRFNERISYEPRKPYGGRVFGKNFFASEMQSVLPLEVVHSGVVGLTHHDEVQRAVIAALPVDVVDLLKTLNLSPKDFFSDKAVSSRAVLLGADHVVRSSILSGLGTALGKTEASLRAKIERNLSAGLNEELLPALRTSDLNLGDVRRILAPSMERGASDPLNAEPTGAGAGATFTDTSGASRELSAADRTRFADSFSHASLGTPAGATGLVGRNVVSNSARLANLLDAHKKIVADKYGTDNEPKRVLFIEEVQSDWHQRGRKEGYQTGETRTTVREDQNVWVVKFEDGKAVDVSKKVASNPEEAIAEATKMRNEQPNAGWHYHPPGVPDAPFKTTWPMLAMKRMIRYAAENGFDRIAWTTGEQQAARYDLSKQISSVSYSGTNLKAFDHDGKEVISRTGVSREELPDIIGKDAADKLMAQEPKGTLRTIEGEDLKVGGEGMKAFYDRMLPNEVNKYVKKWGAKVGTTEISQPNKDNANLPSTFNPADAEIVQRGEVFQVWADDKLQGRGNYDTRAQAEAFAATGGREDTVTVPSMNITPSMRDSAMQGQPLFARAPGLPESRWMSTDQISEITEKLVGEFAHKPPIRIIDRASDVGLPKTVDAAGFVRGGKIHLVRAGLAGRSDLVQTFYHELLHYGIRRFMTRSQYINAMQDLALRDAWIAQQAARWVAADPAAQALKAKGESDAYLQARGVDEALAALAETNAGDFADNSRLAKTIRAVSRWIAKLAEKLGFTEAASKWRGITNDDARALINGIFTRLREDAQATQSDVMFTADTAFSVKKSAEAAETEGRPGLFGMEYTGPLDMAVKAVVKATKFDRATAYLHDVLIKEKIGSLIPEKMKAGIVDRYGVPERVQDMRNQVKINTFKAIRDTGTLVERIASISREESRILHAMMASNDQTMIDYLTDKSSPEGRAFIDDAKKMIADMTTAAIDVGLVSEDATLRNKNAYVHRSYQKYVNLEQTRPEVATRTRAMRILGETYKGRGMRHDVSMEALAIETKGWWTRKVKATGAADTAMKGEKFIRLERRAPLDDRTKTLTGIPAADKKGRLLEVRYWPESEAVPAAMKGWDRDVTTWEARFFDKAKKVGMWRDFVPAERQMMGEIDEVKYITAKTIILMAHDIEVAKYFKWVGEEYGQSVAPEGVTPLEGSELLRHAYTPDTWVRVPGTKIPGTNLQVYGKLADKFIPGPIWNDIRQVSRMRTQNVLPDALANIIRMWKINKTALTPGVHMNNIMGNVMMADWHDVLARHTAKAIYVLYKKSENPEYDDLYKDFEASGATLGMYAHQELRSEIMEPLEDALRQELVGAKDEVGSSLSVSNILSLIKQNHIAAAAGEAMAAAKDTKAYNIAAQVVGKAIDAYQIEDEVFRLAAFIKAKEDGKTDAEAGKFAKRAFLDYDITAPWINALRQTILPFVAFPYRAIPMMAETAAHRPWKVMKMMMIAGSLNALVYALLGGSGDEDRERKVLPPEKSGKIWGIIPKLIRMPWNHGDAPVFLDIRRFVIVGDVLDTEQSHSAIPLLPFLNPAGPLATVSELVFNRSSFTGRDITKETDTTKEVTLNVLDHLYKSFMPNIPGLPGSYATKGIWNAGTGRTDDFGREQSFPMAMLSSVGVKVSAYPRDVALQNIMREHNRKKSEIEATIFGIGREYEKHGISAEQRDIKMQYQINKLKELDKELISRIGE